jgi:tetratricopeptide (TPR) repeat protein
MASSSTTHRLLTPAAIALCGAVLAGVAASAQSRDSVRDRAFDLAYNLDRDEALVLVKAALASRPDDAALHRTAASLTWLEILFRRGAVTVDDYVGAISRKQVKLPPPPAPLAQAFQEHATRAAELAQARLRREADSADAHYELGAAEGLLASYKATVGGKVLEALGDARRAYNAHERVLSLDPGRKDAGLTVGIYRYVVSSLSLPLRLMAYVVGFGGDKDRGVRMMEEAATYRGDAQAEAQFALVLIYTRERRFADALNVLAQLRTRYPRNRLLWLESGATALRAGRTEAAEQFLREGMARLASDSRPRAFGEEALWRLKRGTALARLARTSEATALLRDALTGEGRDWVRGRAHLELGRLAVAMNDTAAAVRHFDTAVTLCERDNDAASAAEARDLRARLR